MGLLVTDYPARMTTRRRTISFESGDLARILADHCRAQGVEISDECKLQIFGLESDTGMDIDSVKLFIDGD